MELIHDEEVRESTALARAEEFIAGIGAYPDRYHGRGIVICAGGQTYFTNAWIAISLLRHVGCRLPIQLWYLGRDELDPYMEELIRPLGVECVDAHAMRAVHEARILRGWEVKIFAILHSPFREVMLLDADNFVAANPEFLFDSWEYRRTGALFWPDTGRMNPDSEAWKIFGVGFEDEPEFESGQIVVNKETCWAALCLTKHYNDHSDFYYRHVHGDKETFHFAFRKVGQPYAMTSHDMHLEGGTFFQYDFSGKLLFQHRNREKWRLHGENPVVPGFRFEAECRGFLEQLREGWDGTVGGPRPSATLQRTVEGARAELTAGIYRFVREGYGYWPMTFMPDGRVGIGATAAERTWRLRLAGGEPRLEIGSDGGTSSVFAPSRDGGWTGDSGTELAPIAVRGAESPSAPLSFSQFVDKVLAYAEPLSQNTAPGNLGFGWLYYGMARNLAPECAVVIGSARGFAPLCVARGLHDNGTGEVIFIDPGYSGSGDPAWDGRGHWQHQSEVRKWLALFGLGDSVHHLAMRSDDALPVVRAMIGDRRATLLMIDGAHTHEQSLRDYDLYSPLLADGMVLFHDATNPNCGVAETLRVLRGRGLDVATLDIDAGLAIVPVARPPRVDDKWSYLTSPSNRGPLIMQHLRPQLQDGDRVFDAYCGFSPLNAHLERVRIFGFDVDPVVIARLRAEYPGHDWAQIEERQLAYATLPDAVDVLVGLGLSRGYCSWDPQLVEGNLRHLVQRYRPRVCLFEAAAEYHDAEILDDLQSMIERAGYRCRGAVIDTDMASYSRRRLVIGTAP